MRVTRWQNWALFVLPLVLYLVFTLPNLHLPGVYYDEVLQILPAMDAVGYDLSPGYVKLPGTVFGVGDLRIPFMTTSYLGSLQTMIFVPVFALFEPSVLTIRLTFIALGVLTIALTFLWTRYAFGIRAAVITSLLVVTDASYLFYTRIDNGPVTTMMLIKLGLLIAFTYWWKTGRPLGFLIGAFLAGLGIYDKANFLWFIGAGGLVMIVFGLRETWSRLNRRWGLIVGGGVAFVLGALPFIGYVVLSGGGPFSAMLASFESTSFEVNNRDVVANFFTRLRSAYTILSGYGPLNDYTTSFAGVQTPFSRFPLTLQPWVVLAAVASPIAVYIAQRKPLDGRLRVVLALAAATLAMIVMSIFTPTNFSGFHMMIFYPFPHLLIALSALILLDAFAASRAARGVVLGVVALTVATNAAVVLNNHQVLASTEGVGMWSASIYDLGSYLMEEGEPVVCMDWGLCHNLQVLSKGELEVFDRWDAFLYPAQDIAPMQELLEQEGNLFIFHSTPYSGVLTIADADYPRETFFGVAEALDLDVERVREFAQANGETLYEVYRVSS